MVLQQGLAVIYQVFIAPSAASVVANGSGLILSLCASIPGRAVTQRLKLWRAVEAGEAHAEHSGGVEIDEELALQPDSILIEPRTKFPKQVEGFSS